MGMPLSIVFDKQTLMSPNLNILRLFVGYIVLGYLGLKRNILKTVINCGSFQVEINNYLVNWERA